MNHNPTERIRVSVKLIDVTHELFEKVAYSFLKEHQRTMTKNKDTYCFVVADRDYISLKILKEELNDWGKTIIVTKEEKK